MALAIMSRMPGLQQQRSPRVDLLTGPSRSFTRVMSQRRFSLRAQAEKPGAPQTVGKGDSIDESKLRVEDIEPGNLSNEAAEARADLGKVRRPAFTEAQAFDGPAPETINSRLAMLGVTSALAAEFVSGVGLKQQVVEQPLGILAAFVIISLASYIPISRGFTRKEPYATPFWNPKAENWNGRAAMIGFAGILLTEALSGKTIPAFYGLPHGGF